MGEVWQCMEGLAQSVFHTLSISCLWISSDSINFVAMRWWAKEGYEWNSSLDHTFSLFLSHACGTHLGSMSLWLRDDRRSTVLNGRPSSICFSLSFYLMSVDLIGLHQLRSYEMMGERGLWMERFSWSHFLTLSISCVWISSRIIVFVATRWWAKYAIKWKA